MAKSELYGDWEDMKRIMGQLKTNHDDYTEVIKVMGEKIAERVWDLIESQGIDMAPLEEEYKRRKIAKGRDERILISTGDFLNSIQVTDIQSDGDSIMVFIGVEDGITETGIPMGELAYYIENGTSKQPARMPFLLSWAEMQHDVTQEVSAMLQKQIEEALT